MFFNGRLEYDYHSGFGTRALEPVISVLGNATPSESSVVEMAGIGHRFFSLRSKPVDPVSFARNKQ